MPHAEPTLTSKTNPENSTMGEPIVNGEGPKSQFLEVSYPDYMVCASVIVPLLTPSLSTSPHIPWYQMASRPTRHTHMARNQSH